MLTILLVTLILECAIFCIYKVSQSDKNQTLKPRPMKARQRMIDDNRDIYAINFYK